MYDKKELFIKAGDGGSGIISFRQEKFVPFGGPDGGDGGDGGDVIIKADPSVTSLRIFRQKRSYQAGNGMNGWGKKKHGRKGDDLILNVPLGTVVSYKSQTGGTTLIADLEESGQKVVVARGGKGGLGNIHFVSSTNQAPRIAQKGEAGEETSIFLELKLIADVGIIGYPNVGKSTLLAAASAARPEIASYPFTTREPILGVVEVGRQRFVLAEIPGLIDGAHLGRGLGHDFLRHVGRTKMLIHLIDGSSESPVEDMLRVNAELGLFDPALAQKPQLVAVNKIDLPRVQGRLAGMRSTFKSAGISVHFVSAATGEGVAGVMAETMERLQEAAVEKESGKKVQGKVFRPQPMGTGPRVLKEGDVFIVVAPGLEGIYTGTDATDAETRHQLRRQLNRLGVSKALQKAGIKPGDRVRCGHLEWEW